MSKYTTERELLIAVKKSNFAAFENLLRQYERPIFSYVFHMVNSRLDAEDITQDIFVKVYEKRRTIDPDRNFKSWLYTVSTHTVYDWLRKKRRMPEIINFESVGELPETPETLEGAPAYYFLEEALRALNSAHRTILLLFYKEDRAYQEIADILDIPMGTVKTHLYRAKRALKKIINNNNDKSR